MKKMGWGAEGGGEIKRARKGKEGKRKERKGERGKKELVPSVFKT